MFKELLRELVDSVDGAIGAVIMGMDGISVEDYCERPETDLQVIGIESSSIVKEMGRAAASMDTGAVGEVIVVAESRTILVRRINEEYFITLVLNGLGNLGKGRFKLKILVPKISREFE